MRSAPLLRSLVARPTRTIAISTALVAADDSAFAALSVERQEDLSGLRTAFYIEALSWAIDCNFAEGFALLLPRVRGRALGRRNLDGDTVAHVAVGAEGCEFLKTVVQTIGGEEGGNDGGGGEELSALNAKGETPLDLVIERGDRDKFAVLVMHGVRGSRAQLLKARERGITVSEAMLLRASG